MTQRIHTSARIREWAEKIARWYLSQPDTPKLNLRRGRNYDMTAIVAIAVSEWVRALEKGEKLAEETLRRHLINYAELRHEETETSIVLSTALKEQIDQLYDRLRPLNIPYVKSTGRNTPNRRFIIYLALARLVGKI